MNELKEADCRLLLKILAKHLDTIDHTSPRFNKVLNLVEKLGKVIKAKKKYGEIGILLPSKERKVEQAKTYWPDDKSYSRFIQNAFIDGAEWLLLAYLGKVD